MNKLRILAATAAIMLWVLAVGCAPKTSQPSDVGVNTIPKAVAKNDSAGMSGHAKAPVSQIANRHVEKVSDVLKVGQVVTAKVVEVDPMKGRVSLSMKAVTEPIDQAKA